MLCFKSFILVSKMLDKMEAKSYFEYFLRQYRKQDQYLKGQKITDDERKEQKEEFLMSEIASYVLTKLHMAENEIVELFMIENEELSREDVLKMPYDDIKDTLKKLLVDGLPDMIKTNLMTTLKKTMSPKT